jgi:hypothetical protein
VRLHWRRIIAKYYILEASQLHHLAYTKCDILLTLGVREKFDYAIACLFTSSAESSPTHQG